MKPKLPNGEPALQVNILLFEAFSNMLLACLLEPLRVVRDEHGAAIAWTVLSADDGPVQSSSGLALTPDCRLAEAAACDLLVIIGGDRFRTDATDQRLRRGLRLVRKADAIIAADTGAWLLAEAGYLAGKRATLHWQLLAEFAERYPETEASPAPYVIDGRWMTCGSAAGALELVLQEITRRFGDAARFDAAAMFLNQPATARSSEPAFGGLLAHPHAGIRRVLERMAANIEKPLPLAALARSCGLTLRTMARLFETELAMPPGRCYTQLRLARARELMLQPGLSRGDIASMCGFSCAASLTRALGRSKFQAKLTLK